MMQRSLLRTLAALTIAGAASAGAFAAEPIRIGVTDPLSGPQANSGVAMRQAYELAAKEVNDKGGLEVDGEKRPIELFFEDSQSRPEVGMSAAQKLLTRDQVDIVIADAMASSVTLATMDLASGFGKFMVSGQPVSIEISRKIAKDPAAYANFWKMSFNSDAYAHAIFDSVKQLVEAGSIPADKKTIAFIFEDTDYGKSNVEFMAPLFEEIGWTVVARDAVPNGAADFFPQLSKLRGDEPAVIVSIFTAPNSGAALVKQIKEQGIGSTHFAVYYPIRAEFAEAAGAAAEGLLWTPLNFDPINNAEHKQFAQMVDEKIKVTASGDHAFGYCQFGALIDAIGRAKSLDPAKLSEAFVTMDFPCVYGRWVYDPAIHAPMVGDGLLATNVAQVQNGVSQVIWPKSKATSEFKP